MRAAGIAIEPRSSVQRYERKSETRNQKIESELRLVAGVGMLFAACAAECRRRRMCRGAAGAGGDGEG